MRAPGIFIAAGFVAFALASVGGCEAIVKDRFTYVCGGNDPSACPSGQSCIPATGKCVDDALACTADAVCPSGTTCDAYTQMCVSGLADGGTDAATQDGAPNDANTIDSSLADTNTSEASTEDAALDAGAIDSSNPSGALGASCDPSTPCAGSLLCADSTILSTSAQATGSVCTKPCCKTEECGAGFVCYGAGTGGNYCVEASAIGRTLPSNGGASGGEACNGNAPCRSGLCIGNACADTCCGDPASDCANDSCVLSVIDQHATYACVAPPGNLPNQAACTSNAQCASGTCAFNSCRPHCCGVNDCEAVGYTICAYRSVTTGTIAQDVSLCLYPGSGPKTGNVGDPCTSSNSCNSGVCDVSTGTCADVCCEDSDCTPYGAGYKCLPTSTEPRLLHCTQP